MLENKEFHNPIDNNLEKQPLEVDLFSIDFENKIRNEGKLYRKSIDKIQGKEVVEEAGFRIVGSDPIDGKFVEGKSVAVNPGDVVLEVGRKLKRKVYTPEEYEKAYDENGSPIEYHVWAMENPFDQKIIAKIGENPEDSQEGNEQCFIALSVNEDGDFTQSGDIFQDEKVFLKEYELVKTELEKKQESFLYAIEDNNLFNARKIYNAVPELKDFINTDENIKKELARSIAHGIQYSDYGKVEGFKRFFNIPDDVVKKALKMGLQFPINEKDFGRVKDYIELFDIDRDTFMSLVSEIPKDELLRPMSDQELDKIFDK
jgi:hypothetical protein